MARALVATTPAPVARVPASAATTPAPAAAVPQSAPQAKTPEPLPGRELAPGVRELTFADGSVYRSAMRGRNLHGKGELIAKAFTYEGEMRLGQPAGRGVFWFVDGTRFEGVFEDGLARARGEIIKQDGARTPAAIVDGKAKLLD